MPFGSTPCHSDSQPRRPAISVKIGGVPPPMRAVAIAGSLRGIGQTP